MRRLMLGLVIGLVACTPTEPTSKLPMVGRYYYEGPVLGTGSLTIAFTSADSIHGTWQVHTPNGSSLIGETFDGTWREEYYYVKGRRYFTINDTSRVTVYTHRLRRIGNVVTCFGYETAYPTRTVQCALTYQGN